MIAFNSTKKKSIFQVAEPSPAGIYLFKVNNIRTICEICSKLTIKKPERTHCSGVSIVDFEQVNAG